MVREPIFYDKVTSKLNVKEQMFPPIPRKGHK